MHRRSLLAAAGATAALAAAPARPQPPRTALAVLADPSRADSVLGVGMIARGRDGRVVLAEAQGRGVLGEGPTRRERAFTLDTPVRVASISKLVAMTGFMRLVERGAIGLDDDVSRTLGFRLRHPAHPDVAITPRRLASHTAGLRNGEAYPVPVGRRLQDALTPGAPLFENGGWFAPPSAGPDAFAYADVNFAVLAQLIERLGGERFDRFMTRTLLRPLRLDAGYNWSGVGQARRDLASACCRKSDGVWSPQVDAVVPPAPQVRILAAPDRPGLTADDVRLGENGFAFSPQGGLRASVRDLDRLARAYGGVARGARGGPLTPSSLAQMQAPAWRHDGRNGDTTNGFYRAYGLAVQIPTGIDGAGGDAFFGPGSSDWRGHFGEAYGLVSGLFWNTKDGRTLSWIINGTPSEAKDAPGRRSALTAWEEAVIDAGLGAQAKR